jgi:hypothetical protein
VLGVFWVGVVVVVLVVVVIRGDWLFVVGHWFGGWGENRGQVLPRAIVYGVCG